MGIGLIVLISLLIVALYVASKFLNYSFAEFFVFIIFPALVFKVGFITFINVL